MHDTSYDASKLDTKTLEFRNICFIVIDIDLSGWGNPPPHPLLPNLAMDQDGVNVPGRFPGLGGTIMTLRMK